MPDHPRRPPPGRSFPFLRKGDGQKAKINYPILQRAGSFPKSEAGGEDKQLYNSKDVYGGKWQTKDVVATSSESDGAGTSANRGCQHSSVPRTIRTNDDGFVRACGSPTHDDDESSSSSEEVSPTSSSIAQPNIELRKQKALPLQKLAREENYSLTPPTVGSTSPMLASTPQPRAEWQLPQQSQHVPALETSILGDITNQADEAVLSPRNEKKSPGHRDGNTPVASVVLQQAGSVDSGNLIANSRAPHPGPGHGIRPLRQRGYTDVEKKLVEQLRNAIAHLDLADMEQQKKAKELEEAYLQFRDHVREFEEQKDLEKERVQRVRRQLERERKTINKTGGERDKVVAEQIEDLMKAITQKDRQISSLRLRLRKAEELSQTKEKELEENNKKVDRLERTVNTLQRQLAQVRGNYAKQTHEMAAELQASRAHNLRRKGSIGLLPTVNDQTVHGKPVDTVDSQVSEQQRATQERQKSVSWADKPVPAHVLPNTTSYTSGSNQMKFMEQGVGYFGLCRLFKNEIGDWTKVTTTDCGCDFYEYSNSDVRWISCDRTVEVNYFGIVGATVVTLIKGCSIRYFNNGQIELYRLSGEISRFDPVTKRRTETMIHSDGSKYVEIFDSTGCFVRIEGTNRTSHNFGERSSYRGHPSDRHVYNHSNSEPEWIEPEYNARRCPDGSLKIKFSNVMVCCLGVEDVGYVKHTTRLENGSERKRMCVEWGHVARARQRQIEARKCQELVALNATIVSLEKVFKRKPSRARLRGALEPFLERWITTTFRAHTTESNACANELFAPIPTMCALYAVTQALPKSKCSSVRDLFEFNVECLHELRNCIASQPRLSPSTVYSFLKIIVDDDDKTLVSDSFIRKMKELFTDEVVLACSPQKVARFLRSLTGGAIDGPRSVHGLTSFYASAGLKARWCGKAVAANSSAFASTYSLRQKHPFIQVETDAKKINVHNCEIWELPLKVGSMQFHLCLIRPRFLGDILKLKMQMLGQDLKDILNELLRTKSQHCKILLPVFSLKCEENLEHTWMKHGTGNMGEDAVLPPFDAIWNVTKLSISLEGVNTLDLKLAPNPLLPPSYRSYYTSDDLWQPHPAPGTSIDSSFLFVITQRGSIPLLAGCYAGHPPPSNAAFTLLAPNRIRSKPPPKIDSRPNVKLTKKQKKALKVRRQRAAKIKMRAERPRNKSLKKKKETDDRLVDRASNNY